MEIFKKSFKVHLSLVIMVVSIIVIGVLTCLYFQCDGRPKIASLIGSLVAGFIVALIQFIIAFRDYQLNEKLKELELIKVLYNRTEESYYASLIKNAKNEIKVMGVTAHRMIDDFADLDDNAPDNKRVLLKALENHVKVQILLPAKEHLPQGKSHYYDEVNESVSSINKSYRDNPIEVRHFDHIAAQSIFKVDDECIIGPVLTGVESRNTPSLHLKNKSPFADKYLKYFENEWDKASNE